MATDQPAETEQLGNYNNICDAGAARVPWYDTIKSVLDMNTIKFSKISGETTYLKGMFAPTFGIEEDKYVKEQYRASSRKRHRLCFHQNPGVDLHDIIITYDSSSYIPPNKHVGKPESICILQGEVEVFFFSDEGKCFGRTILSDYSSGKPFYCRIPANTWHGLRVISSESCVVKETIAGPYSAQSLKWAGFAPTESDALEDREEYYGQLSASAPIFESSPDFVQVSDTVWRSSSQISILCSQDLRFLKEAADSSPLQRARVCMHEEDTSRVQEMMIYLSADCEIPGSYHIRKDESALILEGEGTYEFCHQNGDVAHKTKLSAYNTLAAGCKDSSCFARINRYTPHVIKPGINGVLLLESTTGPFIKTDTDYFLTEA